MKPEKPKKTKAPAKRTRATKASEPTAPQPLAARAAAPRTRAAARAEESEPAPVKRASGAAKRARATTPKPPTRRSRVSVPSILLEGDAPVAPRPSGPGERYAVPSVEKFLPPSEPAELPEAYGTQRLLLLARDPHWVFAHWDMTHEQLRQHNGASRDGHLVVRVYRDQPAGKPVVEQHVHPESRSWFLHVGRGGTKFVAQLGFYDRSGTWTVVATSSATFTPPDALSEDLTVRFETIPVEVPFRKLLEAVKGAVTEHRPLMEAIREIRASGHSALPEFHGTRVGEWTPEQERALAAVVNIDEVRRVWMGSLEITELIRRSLEQEISSQAAAALARGEQVGAQPGGIFSVSSPFGGEGKRKGFWFNVNAELIIYGATEPDATVTIGGRKIQLRRDGTFSFRFALPDGRFDLPVQATSAGGDDARAAKLQFSRGTEYRGEVGQHPQDKALKTPRAENVA
jgi:uncharacterized protein